VIKVIIITAVTFFLVGVLAGLSYLWLLERYKDFLNWLSWRKFTKGGR